ncbi:MAG: hypothetical protein EZS28_012760 [Streblomastix strix]|uniref:Uncharacterized protein n=1 Tax=Streblomastix strix TaxID=222440 RepID=A0A5J4W9U1_9EUKA|nr:MAG: hypothetical protein EZS28_012760 [Streblomastix strix]
MLGIMDKAIMDTFVDPEKDKEVTCMVEEDTSQVILTSINMASMLDYKEQESLGRKDEDKSASRCSIIPPRPEE